MFQLLDGDLEIVSHNSSSVVMRLQADEQDGLKSESKAIEADVSDSSEEVPATRGRKSFYSSLLDQGLTTRT